MSMICLSISLPLYGGSTALATGIRHDFTPKEHGAVVDAKMDGINGHTALHLVAA